MFVITESDCNSVFSDLYSFIIIYLNLEPNSAFKKSLLGHTMFKCFLVINGNIFAMFLLQHINRLQKVLPAINFPDTVFNVKLFRTKVLFLPCLYLLFVLVFLVKEYWKKLHIKCWENWPNLCSSSSFWAHRSQKCKKILMI